jgi:peptidoglycan-N-acetylglucosamine deacetylase
MSGSSKIVFHDPDGQRARRVNILSGAIGVGAVVVFAGVAAGLLFAPKLPVLSLGTAKAELSSKAETDAELPTVRGLVADRRRQVPSSAVGALRFAFFTAGDPSSFISLRQQARNLDAIMPDWVHFTQGKNGDLALAQEGADREAKVRTWLKRNAPHVRIYPRLENGLPPARVSAMLATAAGQQRAARDVSEYLSAHDYAGILVDLSELPLSAHFNLATFVRLLVAAARPQGRKVILALDAVDATPQSQVLVDAVDSVLLETFAGPPQRQPGPAVSQGWFEDQMASAFVARNRGKIIVGIGCYGTDWDGLGRRRDISVQSAWDIMRASGAPMHFSAPSLNSHFTYEKEGLRHEVWFLDAVSAFNQVKSALALRPAGVALWKLGMEDPGIWGFFGRGRVPDQNALAVLREPRPGNDIYSTVDGELIEFRAGVRNGRRELSYNQALGLIVRQSLTALPMQAELWTPAIVDKKLIALTFDDGPDPRYTPAILDILAEKGAKATFFVIGKNAVANPDLLRRIFDEGHDIGNHTYSHPDLLDSADSPVEFELNATQRVLESILGRHTIYFRPPYASRHLLHEAEAPHVIEKAAQLGYLTVSAFVDPFDWVTTSGRQIDRSTVDQIDAEMGQIVLLHDSGGNRKPTIEALPKIIDGLKARGFELAPVHRLLGMSRDAVMPPVETTSALSRIGQNARSAWYGILRAFDASIPVVVIGATVLGALRLALIVIGAHVQRRRELQRDGAAFCPATLAVLVPAYNEAKVVCNTVRSLLDATLEIEFDIVVIDDGSKDETAAVVRRAFAGNSRVQVFEKPNGGKSTALNYGLRCTNAEVVVAIDADTLLDPDAIGFLVRHFGDPELGAVAGSAMVGNKINLLTRFQAIEYAISQNLDRRAFELFNAISVVPGAIGAWRREALLQVGGYASDTLAEDADLTVALERQGWKVIYEPRALARTEAPETLRAFLKQRYRWLFGTLQVAHKNAGAILRHGPLPLALITLPNVYLFQYAFSLIAPLMDAILLWTVVTMVLASAEANRFQEIDTLRPLVAYWAFFQMMDVGAAIAALRMDITRSWALLPLIVLQRFCYRQLLYVVALRSVVAAVKGRFVGWGKLARTGRVQVRPAS